MADRTPLPSKKEVARALLLRGSCFVHVDPRVEGVVVPDWLRRQPQLVLQIGLDMPVPIHDLRVDDDGVSGTLSFNRTPFECHVGWPAVFALVGDDGKGMVWPEDIPPEIAEEVDRETARRRTPLAALDAASGPQSSEAHPRASEARPRPARRTTSPRRVDPAPALRPRARARPADAVDPDDAPTIPNDAAHDDAPTHPDRTEERPGPKGPRRPLPPYLRVVK